MSYLKALLKSLIDIDMKKQLNVFFIGALLIICGAYSLSAQTAQTQKEQEPNLFSNLKFRNVGPTRGGRVTTVTGVADDKATFYMGSTGGGVWKTTDYGASWKNISDGYFNTPSIGAMRVAPSDKKTLYVGTGSDGIRSNVITGKGVYKSVDEGKTWKHIGLEKTGQIGAVEIHPGDPNTVFVAAIGQAFNANKERGVYRTKDGGDSWEQVLFVSDTTGAVDLEISPDNPEIIYASMWRGERKPWTVISGGKEGGIYKSTDGGDSWKKLTNGLPKGLFGKSDLAISPANPAQIYVLIEAPVGEGGVYRSDDRGENWELVSTKKDLLDRPFYYCNLDISPQDPNTLYASATSFFKSTDGGKTWQRMRTPHGDNHDIWINPKDPDLFIQANDGGANITLNGGKTWSSQTNQPTAELYQVEVDDQFPYWIYAGQQDNSTIALPSLPPYSSIGGTSSFWMAVGGCETGPVVPKPGNPDIVYANCKGRFGVYNKKTGQEKQYYVGASNMYGHNPKDLKFRFQRVSPIHVSPHNPDVVYHTSQYVHKTTDDGVTWEIISPDLTAFEPETQVISGSPITRDITGEEFYSTIYAIRESSQQEGVIWVGANDGPVHVTTDGGKKWANVTPKELPAGGRIDCVEPSPHKAGKAYFTSLRFQLGDWKPYIYKTEDFGQSWTLLSDGSNGIPADYPVRVVREDPSREGLLYAGTEFGLFISFNDGKDWMPFQQNLPVTPISDMKVHQQDLVISTMGRSFWIFDNLSALHQLPTDLTLSEVKLFSPRDAYRMRYGGGFRLTTDGVSYPAPALTIDYYLPEKTTEDIWLEILDQEDKVIQRFSSGNPEESQKDGEPSMSTGFFLPKGNPKLDNTKGLHRFNWNMRHPGATSGSGRSRGGPVVTPGKYTLRMKLGQKQWEEKALIKIDPRVEAAGVTQGELKEQESLALKLVDLQNESRQLRDEIKQRKIEIGKAMKEALEKKEQQRLIKEKEALEAKEIQLVTAEGRYQTPMLIDQINYLSSMLNRADQKPGKDAVDRYQELREQFDTLKESLQLQEVN